MLNNALFGSNSTRGINKNLVEFKAGKMTMRGKMVYPDNRKGQLYVYQSEDSLIHFCWKDRITGVVEDDLIIFPEDCEFKHVTQCKTGRVYLLKFKSSNRKFFFWLQDLKTDKDEEFCRKMNEVLNNPPSPGSQRSSSTNPEGDLQNLLNNMSQQQLMQLFGNVGHIGGLSSLLGTMNRSFSGNSISTDLEPPGVTPAISVTSSPTVTDSKTPKSMDDNKVTQPTKITENSISSKADNNRIRLSDLQSFLSGMSTASNNIEAAAQRGVANELSAAIPAAIFVSESLESMIGAHLPAGDNLSTTLSSPQFSQALSMFWSALQSGQAAPMVQQFGLGADVISAATCGNVEQFVNALEAEASGGTNSDKLGTPPIAVKQQEEVPVEKNKVKNLSEKGGTKNDKEDEDDEGMALD